jgi:hypothetical protein
MLCALSALALAACSAGGNHEYDMSASEVRSKLLSASFKKGLIPGFSSHNVKVHQSSEGNGAIEWLVMTDGENGMYCPIVLKPAGEDGKRTQVVNDCRDDMLGRTAAPHLDELVDATLTGRPPKFD